MTHRPMTDVHGEPIDERTVTEDNKVRVFVYGTLMTGFINQRYANVPASDHAEAVTVEDCFVMSGVGFPLLARTEEEDGLYVIGEVVPTNEEGLTRMDYLEGHPHWYRREVIEVLVGDDFVHAYIYLLREVQVRGRMDQIMADCDWRQHMNERRVWNQTEPCGRKSG